MILQPKCAFNCKRHRKRNRDRKRKKHKVIFRKPNESLKLLNHAVSVFFCSKLFDSFSCESDYVM